MLDWVAVSFSGDLSNHMDQTCISCFGRGFFTSEPPGKPVKRYRKFKNMINAFMLSLGLHSLLQFLIENVLIKRILSY